MEYYREYRGFEIHFEDEADGTDETQWIVRGYGLERTKGIAKSRQEAFFAACASIDAIKSDPYRFPVNLIGYPDKSEGDVVTRDGEIIGRWCLSGNEALEFIDFIPEGTEKVRFRNHHLGILCSYIRKWHEGDEKPQKL